MNDATDKWVARLNKLAREIDEDAATIHPSAWKEQLGDLYEKYRKLAGRGPNGD